MLISTASILLILEKYKYIVIFPIAVIEGPIIIVISGFLVYLGYLNFVIAYIFLVVGDLVGDSMYYGIGKYLHSSPWMQKVARHFGYNENSAKVIENHFKNHTIKTLILAKVSHGLGIPVQITAGIAKLNFSKYITIETAGTLVKTLGLMILGYYVGGSYVKINSYLHNISYIALGLGLATILTFILRKHIKQYLDKKNLG